MDYKLLEYNGKRPNNSAEILKKELVNYITQESKIGHFPSRRELEHKFHLKLDCLFKGIDDLYISAGLKYKLMANQEIKIKKAKILLDLIIKNVNKLGFTYVEHREPRQRGIDLLVKRKNKIIGIELKALNKFEKIKIKDIKQVERFIENERLDRVLIITTASKNNFEINSNRKIRILYYHDILKIIKSKKFKNKLEYIRNASTNTIDLKHQDKKQKILDYVYNKHHKENKKPVYLDIQRDLHVNLYSYFMSLADIYKELKIIPPTRCLNGPRSKNPDKEIINLWKSKSKEFIVDEITNGRKYPSGVEIGNHLGVSHIWNFVNVNELYNELGLEPYLKRKTR